jgi:hypothetical protein
MAGAVTLSTRYNPWGKPIEIDGTGNFDASFIGTLIDATTGLIYIGNGQYYDPETGRFLTRGVNPNSTNPYMPWNPSGLLIGSMGLVMMILRSKRGRHASKFVTMLTLVIPMAFFLVGCTITLPCGCTGTCGQAPSPQPETPAQTSQPAGVATEPAETPTPASSPDQTPTHTDPCADGSCTSTPSPTPTPGTTQTRFEKIIFICGRGDGTACATGNAPLHPFREWAMKNGYQDSDFKIHDNDSDSCNGSDGKRKLNCANLAINEVNTESNARFLLIGHSAGADSVIIAGDRIADKSRIAGITLLDPSMEATLENDDIQNQEYTDLQIMANNLPSPKFLGDTIKSPGDEIDVSIIGAYEVEYLLSHAGLALSESVVTDMVTEFGWSEMQK